MIRRSFVLLICVSLLIASCMFRPKEIPKDERPLFGEMARTPEEKLRHTRLIEDIIEAAGGTEEDGFRILILAAWKEIEKKNYRAAIKRFNLAWLIEPMNPEVFYGFGIVFVKMKRWDEAFKWTQIAAGAGHARAQTNLAWMYLRGLAVERNPVLAAEWYRRAAEQGVAQAQNALGILLDYGLGVDEDRDEAEQWYRKADAGGYDGPWKKFRKIYFGKMFDPEKITFEDVLIPSGDDADAEVIA